MECVQKCSLCRSKFWFIFLVSCWFNKTLFHSVTFPHLLFPFLEVTVAYTTDFYMYFWSGCQCCNSIHLHLDQTPMENTYPQWWCLPPVKAGNCLQPQATGGLRGLKNIHLWQWRCAEFADQRSLWFPPDSCRCMHDPDQKPTTVLDLSTRLSETVHQV